MTYCVGLRIDRGLVFAADTRTNAGVDNVAVFRKMHVWEKPGERVLVILTAGNLAVTQAVVTLLNEAVDREPETGQPSLASATTMFQAARLVGEAVREVKRVDGAALEAGGGFSASLILGGQIHGEPPRLFLVYSEGNFIESTKDTPFFQVGEHKYGKPILDRVTRPEMRMADAAKMMLLSFDSTIRSNLSVGMPIDLLIYRTDTLKVGEERRIAAEDPYYRRLSRAWSEALRDAFEHVDEYEDSTEETDPADAPWPVTPADTG
ncbi:MAG: proteasome-type protease [Gammaproteobacteria bacterium]|nr:proteasome-type protease [Gammaproteobacteria bacterium]